MVYVCPSTLARTREGLTIKSNERPRLRRWIHEDHWTPVAMHVACMAGGGIISEDIAKVKPKVSQEMDKARRLAWRIRWRLRRVVAEHNADEIRGRVKNETACAIARLEDSERKADIMS